MENTLLRAAGVTPPSFIFLSIKKKIQGQRPTQYYTAIILQSKKKVKKKMTQGNLQEWCPVIQMHTRLPLRSWYPAYHRKCWISQHSPGGNRGQVNHSWQLRFEMPVYLGAQSFISLGSLILEWEWSCQMWCKSFALFFLIAYHSCIQKAFSLGKTKCIRLGIFRPLYIST